MHPPTLLPTQHTVYNTDHYESNNQIILSEMLYTLTTSK